MAKTRSKGAAKGAATTTSTQSSSNTSRYAIPLESDNPPKLFILPSKATSEARVVSLLNPRYGKPTRYLVCPETGTYEFTRIAAPNTTPRSWLIEGTSKSTDAESADQSDGNFKAQVSRGAELYVATPIDPFFLVLPALTAQFSTTKRLFLSSDDHFDTVSEKSPHLSEVLRWSKARKLFESRMGAGCDTVEAGDEPMFRLNEDKVLSEVVSKAKRMSEKGLPKSMEERFVSKALEAPVLSLKRENTALETASEPKDSASSGAATPLTESAESQSSVASTDTSASFASEASTTATSVADESDTLKTADVTSSMRASEEVVKLQRLKVAFNFICSSYVPPAIAELLKKMLASGKGPVDFAALDDYVARLTKARQESMMARSASDYSRKRSRDEENEERAEKRRRKEEEEKRKKAGESRGVRDLKKVNTSGMKKMSDFFKKK
ncbi:Ribonuclease H2, subunit B [Pleurostoma richardsiae]|uniref:Ribonuclease H2 subunit B n=1 Tax=Pleurostoma richardsiae TaxID=41990 RepID=A0AA38RKN5_9PEZI|nr:Ribonuclease H2, subunit B [Pleurostoma richardsiae]